MAKRGSIIFVHSRGTGYHLWDAQVAEFGRNYYAEACRLGTAIAGSQTSGARETSLDAEVKALARVIEKRSTRRPVVVGHLLAGTVLLLLAARYSEIIDGIVVVGTAPCYVLHPDYEFGMEEDAIRRMASSIAGSLEEGVRYIASLQLNEAEGTNIQEGWIAQMLCGVTTDDLMADFRLLREADVRHVLGEIRTPTLIVRGEDDRFVSSGAATALHEAIRGSQLVTMEGCGNMPQLVQLARFNAILEKFLSGLRLERNMLALYFAVG